MKLTVTPASARAPPGRTEIPGAALVLQGPAQLPGERAAVAEPHLQPVDADRLARNAQSQGGEPLLRCHRDHLPRIALDIEIALPEQPPVVFGDGRQIERIAYLKANWTF